MEPNGARPTMGLGLLAAIVLAISVPGCHPASPATTGPGVEFALGQVLIESAADTFRLVVEIAESERQMQTGLKRRTHLPEDAGMLFLFAREQDPRSGFWMYRTHLPLSIAFLDADGTIHALREMEPCRSPISLFCRRYRAGVPYHAALEVNRGYFARRGIGVGDRVRCVADAPRSPGQWQRCAFPFSPALPERRLLHPSPGEP